MARKLPLSVPERHQLKVARATLGMPDPVAALLELLGHPSKEEAREIILRLTGRPEEE